MPLFVKPMGGTTCCPWTTTHFSIVLLLLLSMMASDTASAKTVGVGEFQLGTDDKVTITRGQIAKSGYEEKDGKSTLGCPVKLSESGDITVEYTMDKGGKHGCGLDLILLNRKDEYFDIEFDVAPMEGKANCMHTADLGDLENDYDRSQMFYTAYFNMLPFIYGVDNNEFKILNKGEGLQDNDKLCGKSEGSEPGKCKDGNKFRCRERTSFAIGWSGFKGSSKSGEAVFLKPVGEFRRRNRDNQGLIKTFGEARKRVVHKATVKVAKDTEVRINVGEPWAHVKSEISQHSNVPFDCAASPEFYLFKTWEVREGGVEKIAGDYFFFGLLAQHKKRDHIDVGMQGITSRLDDRAVPECGFKVTFDHSQFQLIVGQVGGTGPTPSNVTKPPPKTTEGTTAEGEGGGMLFVIVGVVVVVVLGIIGAVVYFMCLGGEEEGEESGSEMGTKKTTMGQTTGFQTADFTTAKSKTGYMTAMTGKTTTAMTGEGGKTTGKADKTYKTAVTAGKTTAMTTTPTTTKTKGATTTKPMTTAVTATKQQTTTKK